MDQHLSREQEFALDLESGSGTVTSNEVGSPDLGSGDKEATTFFSKLCDRFMGVDDSFVKLGVDPPKGNEGSPENNLKVLMVTKVEEQKDGDFTGKKTDKEKRKKASSAKKPPKPPRPPRGFSLDAADQKLIKELAELAMLKRARIERMKALKEKHALKASSSSNGNLFAMLFTIIFFIVILFQGMSCRNSGVTFHGSPQTAQTNENGLIFIQEHLNPSASNSILPGSKSSNLLEKVPSSDSSSQASRSTG